MIMMLPGFLCIRDSIGDCLHESQFGKLLARCQALGPKHHSRFKNMLHSLGVYTIDLYVSVFPWAKFRTINGAIKPDAGLDHDGYLPSFVQITEGKMHEVNLARPMDLPTGSIVVLDLGHVDYTWHSYLNNKGVYFSARQMNNTSYTVIERRTVSRASEITSDQMISLTANQTEQYTDLLRRIGYRELETGQHYVFLINASQLSGNTSTAIYKQHWQIELFFKWIKQNLKFNYFPGILRNAVLTQIWVIMYMYFQLAYIQFMRKSGLGLQQILRLLQLNLFERRDPNALLRGDPPEPKSRRYRAGCSSRKFIGKQ